MKYIILIVFLCAGCSSKEEEKLRAFIDACKEGTLTLGFSKGFFGTAMSASCAWVNDEDKDKTPLADR